MIHFLELAIVAGRVVRRNLLPYAVQTTVRHWDGQGKSDPMSRILCIVRSLPERRRAMDVSDSVSTALSTTGVTLRE
jgi:hypothetical protein